MTINTVLLLDAFTVVHALHSGNKKKLCNELEDCVRRVRDLRRQEHAGFHASPISWMEGRKAIRSAVGRSMDGWRAIAEIVHAVVAVVRERGRGRRQSRTEAAAVEEDAKGRSVVRTIDR